MAIVSLLDLLVSDAKRFASNAARLDLIYTLDGTTPGGEPKTPSR
jgi:hypothetical protein